MPQMIFVNLPVADVARSTAFYEAGGAVADPHFRQPGAAAMLKFSDEVAFMLLSHERFADFTTKRIVDAHREVQTLICLSGESPAAIDATMERAVGAGARADPSPRQDMGDMMYGRSFEDPDGHIVELMWMDAGKMIAAMSQEAAA